MMERMTREDRQKMVMVLRESSKSEGEKGHKREKIVEREKIEK